MAGNRLPFNILSAVRLSSPIEELGIKNLISVRAMNCCRSNGVKTVGDLSKLKIGDVMKWPKCGRKTSEELVELSETINAEMDYSPMTGALTPLSPIEAVAGSRTREVMELYNIQRALDCSAIIRETLRASEALKNTRDLSLHDIKLHVLAMYENCGVAPDNFDTMISVIDYIADPRFSPFLAKIKEAIDEVGAEIKRVYGQIAELMASSSLQAKASGLCKTIYQFAAVKVKYPFLDDAEVDYCIEYNAKHGELPNFFILSRCLIGSKERNAQLICYRYGLYPDRKKKSIDELAGMFDLTKERVRQLTDADGEAITSAVPRALVEAIDDEKVMFISEDDKWVKSTIRRQRLDLTPAQLLTLINVGSSRLKAKAFKKGGRLYLFDTTLRDAMDFERLEAYIKDCVPHRRTNSIDIEMEVLFNGSHVCRKPRKYSFDDCKPLLEAYLTDALNVKVQDDGILFWRQTHVSDKQMLDIVVELKQIVTISTLIKLCNERYPRLKISAPDVAQNKLLASVGLKGFVPRSERSRYYDSIGDCAYDILKEEAQPMAIADLLAKVVQRGYPTNDNSLKSLLFAKTESRFVRYGGDKCGLRDADYSETEVEVLKPRMRRTFEERLKELQEFVELHHRMPTQNGPESEASISRWLWIIKSEVMEITKRQHRKLDKYLEEMADIPQNRTEYNFLQKCNTYRQIASELGKRPSPKYNLSLYIWFRDANKKSTHTANTRRYFDELLAWLQSHNL